MSGIKSGSERSRSIALPAQKRANHKVCFLSEKSPMKIFVSVPCIFSGGIVAAPTFSAQVQSSATLTWQDTSNNEDGFGIEMLSPTGGDFTTIGTVGPNITQYRLR